MRTGCESPRWHLPRERYEECLSGALRKVFHESGKRIPGQQAIRDLCVFARQDVTRTTISSLDLISCRNFLIYVQPALQEKIISTLH